MLARSPPGRIDAIQWLRALAALSIAFHHALHEAAQVARAPSLQGFLPLDAGVDLFFVISGFVMVHASRDLFGSRAAILPFLRRRLARIAPIYWAATALFLLLAAVGGTAGRPPYSAMEIAASVAFIPYPRPDGLVQPVYGLGWTLNYEMAFYLLFALVLPLPRERAVPAVVLVLMALAAIGQIVPPSWTAPWFWTRSIVLEFGFGVLIGHMALSGVRPTPKSAIAMALAALALLALGRWQPMLLPDRALFYGLPAALLVIAALAVEGTSGGRIGRWLAELGDASYALYLLHPFVLRALALAAGPAIAGVSPLPFVVLGVTLACVVAIMVWRWFERPLTRALQGPRPNR
jgi:exopolysaccharide production protein ExoZ